MTPQGIYFGICLYLGTCICVPARYFLLYLCSHIPVPVFLLGAFSVPVPVPVPVSVPVPHEPASINYLRGETSKALTLHPPSSGLCKSDEMLNQSIAP